MKVERQEIGTVEVLAPQGVLAEDDATQFASMLRNKLDKANPRVVISLQSVPYMDSEALNGLTAAADDMLGRGTRLKLVAISQTCREILELTDLSSRFQFFDSAESAVRSFL